MSDWNPELYLKFERERTQPVKDLASRIEIDNPKTSSTSVVVLAIARACSKSDGRKRSLSGWTIRQPWLTRPEKLILHNAMERCCSSSSVSFSSPSSHESISILSEYMTQRLSFNIRDEAPSDARAISEITELAFRTAAHTCKREHLLVDGLRAANALTISLVATSNDAIVGHVAISPIDLSHAAGAWHGLGPISVVPAWQRSGVGTALMNAVLQRLDNLGSAGCVLVGDPAFYTRFGFAGDPEIVVEGVPVAYTLVRRFRSSNDRGIVKFHRAFDIALHG